MTAQALNRDKAHHQPEQRITERDKFVLRLPQGMRERVADVARTTHRSMNSEIIVRLEASLRMTVPDVEPGLITPREAELLESFRKLDHAKKIALLELFQGGE